MENIFKKFNFGSEPNPNEKSSEEKLPKKKKEIFQTRREFLKTAAAVSALSASAGLASGALINRFLESSGNKGSVEDSSALEEGEELIDAEERAVSLSEIIDFDQEYIELNPEKMKGIKDFHKKKYKENPKLRDSLIGAYYKIGFWDPKIKEAFSKEGVPEKFRYLLIPESHGIWRAVSNKKAKGPYQFMPKTAKSYGLKSRENGDHYNIEERYCPVKSARACASLLKDLHASGGQDWDLALSGYNGGYYWHYLKEAKSNNEPINYEGFLKYLEGIVNRVLKEKKEKLKKLEKSLSGGMIEYCVKKGDTLRQIALKTRVDIEKISELNGIGRDGMIKVGQIIKIPSFQKNIGELKNHYSKQVKREFYDKLSDVSQNLQYPPKFNAVLELIEEGFVKDQAKAYRFDKPIRIEERKGDRQHEIKRGDTSYSLAKRYKVSVKDIEKANPGTRADRLFIGQKIIVPNQEQKMTLRKISIERKIPLENLKNTNLAIINDNDEIPSGYEVRVPI